MSLIFIIFLMMAVIGVCVLIIRYKGIQAYNELKASLTRTADHYHGNINDTGRLKDLSLDFQSEDFSVEVKTIIKRHRKCTNSYSLLIIFFDRVSRNILLQKTMLIRDAIHHQSLIAEISKMLNTIKTDQV